MKSTVLSLIALLAMGLNALVGSHDRQTADPVDTDANTIDMAAPAAVTGRIAETAVAAPITADPQEDAGAVPVPAVVAESPAPQEPPVPQDPPPPPADASPSDVPVPPMEMAAPPVVVPGTPHVVQAPVTGCPACCDSTCCCPVPTEFCLVDPCDGCTYNICVHLPPACAGQAPVVEWHYGLLGRKVAWLCWPCCGKQVKVVDPIIGCVRVWE